MSIGQRDAIKAISPPWLSTGVAEKLLYSFGLEMDTIDEKANQGMRDHMPGAVSDPNALALCGADRVMAQFPNESLAAYGVRLTAAFDTWLHAGAARAVLQQTIGYLTPFTPQARVVSNSSVWYTYVAGANTSLPPYVQKPSATITANWNWDGLTNWWRSWLILYAGTSVSGTISGLTTGAPTQITTSAPHGLATGAQVLLTGINRPFTMNGLWTITVTGASTFTLNGSTSSGIVVLNTNPSPTAYLVPSSAWCNPGPVWGASGTAWGDATRSWGMSAPAATIQGVRANVNQWKGQHSWYTWVIVSFDTTLFDPGSTLSPPNPDGTWATWAKTVAGVSVPARAANATYCDGSTVPAVPQGLNPGGFVAPNWLGPLKPASLSPTYLSF